MSSFQQSYLAKRKQIPEFSSWLSRYKDEENQYFYWYICPMYPLYQRGNPQLRVFLPNFWMKIVRPQAKQLPNVVQFHCSMEMTKYDIKNYLEKIYNIPVVDVRTRIAMGKFRRDVGKGYVIKDDDIKSAYVVLPKDMKFEYPDIFGSKKDDGEEEEKALSEAKKNFQNYIDRNKHRTDVPSWFTI